MSWELPAPPGYVQWKGQLFTLIEPKWAPFFDDPDGAIDWRFLSWGGVRLDDRPLGDPLPCPGGCIPALDDPALTDALAGAWYPDDSIVFGVVVGDETVAFPKNIMEVHEMVNMTIGGRRVGIPYCTLCGSAQVYFTDSVEDGIEIPVLRTSGLLSRSNKVMFDLTTFSAFDTFTGEALTGPLHAAAVTLEQIPPAPLGLLHPSLGPLTPGLRAGSPLRRSASLAAVKTSSCVGHGRFDDGLDSF